MPAPTPRYVIGIDLGTTNTAVAYVDMKGGADTWGQREVSIFEIPQLVAPSEVAAQGVLPSFCYLPSAYDVPPESRVLPWDAAPEYVVGTLAREQGARIPGRLVASAKSWLCHPQVDRRAHILPWAAPAGVPQISPVEASRRYLLHLRDAWNHQMAQDDDAHRLERQRLILTVPASFDEVARELTVQAAQEAGLGQVILLEEPLAAFYAWLSNQPDEREQMQEGQFALVCDVGGGTADFSVVGISGAEGTLRFDRLAVGNHLMLGGDNMDNALARKVEIALMGAPGRLDVQRWHQLVYQCRRAKEALLGEEAPRSVEVALVGSGSSLIGNTVSATLTQADVQALILDGFFPPAPLATSLSAPPRSGLTELGLPYEQDPAITRHLAAFWQQVHPYLQQETGQEHPRPDYLLFNGGVFAPSMLRDRIIGTVTEWFKDHADANWSPSPLTNERLHLAVAMGAAYYGLVRLGEGVRIGSGSPRAYYVGVAHTESDDTSEDPAICLVPRGAVEGFTGRLDQAPFEALANQPVTFHLFSSITRTGDALGEMVSLAPEEVQALPPVRTVLQFGKKGIVRTLPVQLGVRLTEVGVLQLWCQSQITEHRWDLAFDIREAADPPATPTEAEGTPFDQEKIEAAQQMLRTVFEGEERPKVETVFQRIEQVFEERRSAWSLPLLRKLADTLLSLPRDASMQHEVAWFDLLGYCLRPGYGDPVDDWRMQQAWKNHLSGLHFPEAQPTRFAWWQFWRRVGGGLPAGKQAQLYYEARPYIQLDVRTRKPHRVYPIRMSNREKQEAWMTLASLERLPVEIKETLGTMLTQVIKQRKPRFPAWWTLARLGTRHTIYGPFDALVPAQVVTAWLQTVLATHLPREPYVAYALTHLARPAGHRSHDVPPEVQQQVHRWLRKMPDSDHYRTLLEDATANPDHSGMDWLVGEPLPKTAHVILDPQGFVVRPDER